MPVCEIHALAFAYPGGQRLFDNVSFRLEFGAKVALVGQNGAGKSVFLTPLLISNLIKLSPFFGLSHARLKAHCWRC